MKSDKYLGTAMQALAQNRMRSALTMLGIVIGVLSVIVMIGLGQASQAYITDAVKGLGAGVLIVMPGNPKTSSAFFGGFTAPQTLTIDDSKAIETLPGVAMVSPNDRVMSLLRVGRNTLGVTVGGVAPAMAPASGLVVGRGRFFGEQEARAGSKVIVLGSKIAHDLFAGTLQDPLGGRVRLGNQRFRVIGVLASQGAGALGAQQDQAAYMPTRTFQRFVKIGNHIQSIFLKATHEELLPTLQTQIQAVLRQRHGLRPDQDDDFLLQTQEQLLSTVSTITSVFTLLLAGIAAISLLVGGIGIMNIMLVSVTERTREIGVRMSIGAKRRDILSQFLIEAATISVAGGTLGILLGLLITFGITASFGLPFVVSPAAVMGAFAFSGAVGVFFGIFPANKAAHLDPVEALRYE
jgi:putative ABC transport system permease protein